MIYSDLYKKCYPFKSYSDIYTLSQEEKSRLIYYIKHYPGHISDKLLNTRKACAEVEGWGPPKGWKSSLRSFVLPSTGLVDVLYTLQKKCNELISKIEEEQTLTDNDMDNINRILYANKYCRPLSWFFVPTPDGRVSAALKED